MKTKKILLYSMTWPLNLNFHHLVKKTLLPAKFHFNPTGGIFTICCFLTLKRFEWSKSLLLRFKPPHKNSPPSKISHLHNGQISQGFPQVLRTWEDLNLYMGGLGEGRGVGKMLLKNICEGVYMSVKLPVICLQAWKFTKNELEFFTHIFQGF